MLKHLPTEDRMIAFLTKIILAVFVITILNILFALTIKLTQRLNEKDKEDRLIDKRLKERKRK